MSLSITYDTTYSSWTISDYLADWAGYFGDANHRDGEVEDGVNTGGFYPGSLSGTQYALSSPNSDAGFIAGGSLSYSLFSPPAHTVYGSLDSISLGTDVDENASGFFFAPGQVGSILARLNTDGTLDTNFLASAAGADGAVSAQKTEQGGNTTLRLPERRPRASCGRRAGSSAPAAQLSPPAWSG